MSNLDPNQQIQEESQPPAPQPQGSPEQNQAVNYADSSKPPKKKRVWIFVLIPIVLIIAIAVTATIFMVQPGNISRQQAIDIAISHVGGGNANWPEMEFEGFQRAWSVEVFHDGLVHEVYISRFTGEIIRVELDRWR